VKLPIKFTRNLLIGKRSVEFIAKLLTFQDATRARCRPQASSCLPAHLACRLSERQWGARAKSKVRNSSGLITNSCAVGAPLKAAPALRPECDLKWARSGGADWASRVLSMNWCARLEEANYCRSCPHSARLRRSEVSKFFRCQKHRGLMCNTKDWCTD